MAKHIQDGRAAGGDLSGTYPNPTLGTSVVTDAKVASGIDAVKISTGTVSNAEFSYLDGVTSSIQTQINAKQSALTLTTTGTSGAATLASNTLNIPQYSGGSSTAAGSTGQVQYNNAGAFAADSGLFYNGNLGVGTSSPQQRVHIVGAGARLKIESPSGGDPVLEMTGSSGTNYLFTRNASWEMRTDSTSLHVALQAAGPSESPQGSVVIGQRLDNVAPEAALHVESSANNSITYPTSVFKGMSGQTADLMQWKNSGGTILAKITSAGDSEFGGKITTSTFRVTGGTLANGNVLTSDVSGNATWQAAPADSTKVLKAGDTMTGQLQMSSTSTGLGVYNTTDQVTNYERVRAYWSSNTAFMHTEVGGTGSARNLSIGSLNRRLLFADVASSSGFYQFQAATAAAGASSIGLSGSWTASSGINPIVNIAPTISQTGTAGYSALVVNVTETTTGTGSKRLLDLQLGGTSRFFVENSGLINISQNIKHAFIARTASATLGSTSALYQFLDATSGAITITLPTAVGTTGTSFTLKRTDNVPANAVSVATTASQTIDGLSTYSLASQYKYVTVTSNGTNWFVTGNN